MWKEALRGIADMMQIVFLSLCFDEVLLNSSGGLGGGSSEDDPSRKGRPSTCGVPFCPARRFRGDDSIVDCLCSNISLLWSSVVFGASLHVLDMVGTMLSWAVSTGSGRISHGGSNHGRSDHHSSHARFANSCLHLKSYHSAAYNVRSESSTRDLLSLASAKCHLSWRF